MSCPPRQQPRRDIFTEFPASGRAGLIVRYAGDGAERLAHSFADAAERLASTFRGQALDDALADAVPVPVPARHRAGPQASTPSGSQPGCGATTVTARSHSSPMRSPSGSRRSTGTG